MIHGRQSDRCPGPPQGGFRGADASGSHGSGRRRGGWGARLRSGVAALAALGALGGCGDDGTLPGNIRFGQVGSLEVRLEAPLRLGEGELTQIIRWSSSGAWSLEERVSYRGLDGDADLERSPGDPAAYASAYAELNTLINDTGGALGLFIEDLPQDLDPECGPTRTRVGVTIVDDLQNETAAWIRCADGSLGNLTPLGAGPDPAASRIIEVARLARNGTVGQSFASAYAGTVPFGTLDRGDNSPSGVRSPVVITDETAWLAFWSQHAPSVGAPEVDFEEEMVTVAIVGVRFEAGDSVEVRRVLQVDQGTLVELWERIPGDFCTPAEVTHVPYHIVVSPRTPDPVRFGDVRIETVSCGSS